MMTSEVMQAFEAEHDGDTFTIRFPDGHSITAWANGKLIVTKDATGFRPFELSVARLTAQSGEGRSGAGEDAVECAALAIQAKYQERHTDTFLPIETCREYALAALNARQSGEGEREEFRSLDEWDQRDETVLLLVDYTDGDHPLDDAVFAITIGHNNDHNVGDDEAEGWRFAGWCWSHDHYVEGKGKVVGWMPIPHHLAALRATDDAGGAAKAPDTGEGE